MSDVLIADRKTSDVHGASPLDASAVETFAQDLRGYLVRPGDADYDEARSVWNAMIDRQPALIARCSGVADVIEAVRFAKHHGLPLAVRGGGHNIGGSGVCDGGLVVDLSAMRAVRVDPQARRARVQGGATLGDLDHETQAFGLATPGGVVSTTGVAGLTLGGGFGWLSRKFGLAADNLLSADVVTAEGTLLHVSTDEDPDLFWGLRGGGGNFGVVMDFEFALHEVGPTVLFGPTIYRLEDAAEALANYRDFARTAPNDCCAWADLMTAPSLPFLPEAYHGTKVLSILQLYAGDPRDGEAVLAGLRGHGNPIADAVAPTRFTEAQSRLDLVYDKGFRNYWKSHNFTALSDATIAGLLRMAEALPTPQSDILISQVGGAINDVAPDATAYPHRDTAFVLTPGARWQDPALDDACMTWTRVGIDALAGQSTGGAYVNFIAEDEGRERNAYGANYERLAALKAKYDPTNLFRFNQNVKPAT